MCDRNAKDTLDKIEEKGRITNVKFYGDNALMKGEIMTSRAVKEATSIEDASDEEKKQSKKSSNKMLNCVM